MQENEKKNYVSILVKVLKFARKIKEMKEMSMNEQFKKLTDFQFNLINDRCNY